MTTAIPESPTPIARASPGVTRPDGTGRFAVRRMTASISASYHMLSAPEAPAPSAMKRIAEAETNGCIATGATSSPTSAVNTTSDITRGFMSATYSPNCASYSGVKVASLKDLLRCRDGDVARLAGIFGDRTVEPGIVLLLAHRHHGDRHEGVVEAAKLRTLAEIDAFPALVDLEPQFREPARNTVLLHPEGRHGPGMNDVGGGDLHHDRLTGGHDHGRVGGETVFVLTVSELLEFVALQHEAVEGEFVVWVFVTPEPLVTGRLDGHVGLGNFLLVEKHRQREGADEEQDRDGHHRPGHLEGLVVGEGRRLGVGALVEAHEHPDEKRQHKERDDRDDHQQEAVEPLKILRKPGRCRLEAHGPVGRRADDVETAGGDLGSPCRRGEHRGQSENGRCYRPKAHGVILFFHWCACWRRVPLPGKCPGPPCCIRRCEKHISMTATRRGVAALGHPVPDLKDFP